MLRHIWLLIAATLLAASPAAAQTVPTWKQSGTSLTPVQPSTVIKSVLLPSLATGSFPAAGTGGRLAYDSTLNAAKIDDGTGWRTVLDSDDIGSAVQAYDANLATWAGITPAAGIATALATPSSANVAAAVTDETGSGALAFATSPTLVTPLLGTPTSGTLTNCTGLPISTGVSGLAANVATALATPSSANLLSAITDETGTGLAVFATSPTLTTPLLGTPTSGTLTNCTGLPIVAGTTGTLTETRGGTNQTGYTLGDTLYASATDTLSKLSGNTAAIPKVEVQTGNGTISAAPVRRAMFSTRLASTFTVTSSTTPVVVTGLEANVEASKKYGFRFSGWADALNTAGVRYTMNGSATMTSLRVVAVIGTSSGIATAGQVGSLGTVVGVTSFSAGWVEISGTCEVNAAGTLGVYFAQNASNATGSSVYSGASFELWELTN